MIKLLTDDLGRIAGACEVPHNVTGLHEYGGRDKEGILHVEGIATITPPSKFNLVLAADQEHDDTITFYDRHGCPWSFRRKTVAGY